MMRSSVNRELRNIWKHLFREQTVKKLSLSITLVKYLRLTTGTRVEPVAGNDTYLTIDSSWQSAIYQILKQRVAGILLSKIEAAKTYDFSVNDAAQIKIPIYDVYNALIANSVIDINKFRDANASDTEKKLYAKFSTETATGF